MTMTTGDDTVPGVLAAAGLPPLTGPQAVAEQLVMLAHRCADWEVWGGPRTVRYWDALAMRVRAACYAGPTLGAWWERLSRQMSLIPPARAGDRVLLASLLAGGDDLAVLAVLRGQTEMLLVRVRCAVDVRRETRRADAAATIGEETE
jgi:hypothetical protein